MPFGNGGVGANNGGNGNDVSVGVLCIAKGGTGGKYASNSQVPIPNAPAVAGTGDVAAPGVPGNPGLYATSLTIIFPSGNGASSALGGGAAGINGSGSGTNGQNATGYGSGGSGGGVYNGTASATGGNGSAGIVIITEFCSE